MTSPSSPPPALPTTEPPYQRPLQQGLASMGGQFGSGDLTPGYASDESSTSSSLGGGGQRASSGGKRRPKTSGARGILQRTSYWERRVEQGLLSDSSVTEEFPPLQEARAAASNGSKS